MKEEFIVTQEMLHLEFVLESLKNFIFDKDIEKRLNELYRIVQRRLYDDKTKFLDNDLDFVEYKIIFHYE